MAMQILFGSDVGLLSVFTIVGVCVIGAVMVGYYVKKMNQK